MAYDIGFCKEKLKWKSSGAKNLSLVICHLNYEIFSFPVVQNCLAHFNIQMEVFVKRESCIHFVLVRYVQLCNLIFFVENMSQFVRL